MTKPLPDRDHFTMYEIGHASSYTCPKHADVPGVSAITQYDNVDRHSYGLMWFGCGCIERRPLVVKKRKGEL